MNFKSVFSVIENPIHRSYITHKLEDILVIIVCAVFSRIDTLSNIILYAENHIDFLSKNFLVFEIPSKSTIARVLSIIDGEQVSELVI